MSQEKEFQNPAKECDLIMKGGITSGIVYPPAVLKMASTYRFRCIGGASAGAIAAAVTAAAEYGRASGGFERLKEVSDQLSRGTLLQDLFQPSRKTAPLMNTLFGLAKTAKSGKKKSLLRLLFSLNITLLRQATLSFLSGALAGTIAAFLLAWLTGGSLWGKGGILAFLLAWIGGLIGSAARLAVIFFKLVPENFYGLCTGRKDDPAADGPAVLTDWLSANINRIAGKQEDDAPLTFGEISSGDKPINLKMMTSNLSQNLPYEMPFDRRRFIFKESEFIKLFPANVVAHLKNKAHQSGRLELPEGYFFLPESEDLPIIVATRMSLSFPVLISAVPLYTVSLQAFKDNSGQGPLRVTETDLQRNWFSDGGISSNFPIHFFDAWLPNRPTFGITLVSLPDDAFTQVNGVRRESLQNVSASPGASPDGGDSEQEAAEAIREDVFLPKANQPQSPDWKPIPNLFNFLWSIFATAQNYRDNTQAMLPSYRERVVQLRLSDDEGGLNLAMGPEIINRVIAKGAQAGEVLLDEFNFEHHQWVRFRVLMGQLEANLQEIEAVIKDQSFPIDRLLKTRFEDETTADPFPYPRTQDWCERALIQMKAIETLVEAWPTPPSPFFGDTPPRPKPVLRVTPKI